jgi:hypothetical protein
MRAGGPQPSTVPLSIRVTGLSTVLSNLGELYGDCLACSGLPLMSRTPLVP